MAEESATFFAGRRVLVTGASGYVAGALAAKLSAAGSRIVRLSRRALAPLAGAEDVQGDIGDPGLWRDLAGRVDAIFHLAGETSIPAAEKDPAASLAANVVPVIHAIAAVQASATRPMLVTAGTVTQFGLTETLPVSETHPDNPVTVYDLHKLFAERHVLLAAGQGAIRGCCLRLANVYGPGPNTNGAADRGILNRVVRAALAGDAVTIYGDGSPVRDYVYLDDVADAFLAAAAHAADTTGRAFVVGSGQATTLAQAFTLAVDRAEAATGRRAPVGSKPWPATISPIEFRNFVADPGALQRAAGWRARVTLKDGIDRTIRAFLADGTT